MGRKNNCEKIASNHGGEISAQSQPKKGSIFISGLLQ
jgi:signal transduction histidine kinase